MKNILTIVLLVISLNAFSQITEWAESIDGTKIGYTQSGSGSLSLIFVHGWCCSKEFWKFQVPHFSKKYNVVVLDLAGYGESGQREKHSFDSWGDDILAVVKKINPEKYILIGHSVGGYMVLNAATKVDDGLLAIVGADAFRGKLERNYSEEKAKEAYETNRKLSDEEYENDMRDIDRWFVPESDSSNIEWIKNQFVKCNRETCAQGLMAYYLYRNKTTEQFERINCQVFGINNSRSQFDMNFFKTYQIDFKPYYMDNVGHFIMMDNTPRFNELLEEIIKRVE